jgi:hypothetical protein
MDYMKAVGVGLRFTNSEQAVVPPVQALCGRPV